MCDIFNFIIIILYKPKMNAKIEKNIGYRYNNNIVSPDKSVRSMYLLSKPLSK